MKHTRLKVGVRMINRSRIYFEDQRVTSFAASGTYECVSQTGIHTHPVKKGFPDSYTRYLMVRAKGGISHVLYEVMDIIELDPLNEKRLSIYSEEDYYQRLVEYISIRKKSFGFDAKWEYRFYILKEVYRFDPPYVMSPNPQSYVYLSVDALGIRDLGQEKALEYRTGDANQILTTEKKAGKREYLLAWNQKNWDGWDGGYRNVLRMLDRGEPYEIPWAVANSSAQEGDTVYLMKTGSEQGIIAKGIIVVGIRKMLHYDKEKAAKGMKINRAVVRFTGALDYESNEHITLKTLRSKFPDQTWTPQASGIAIKAKYIRELDNLWDSYYEKRIQSGAVKIGFESEAIHIEEEIETLGVTGTDKLAVVRQRVNQGVFRDMMLKQYKKCCLCGVSNPNLLIASHIKPWSKATPKERLDVDNGFLMCPNHDKAFDGGYISFDDEGRIIISDLVDSENRMFLNLREDMKLELTEGNKRYMKYHRENVFEKAQEEE